MTLSGPGDSGLVALREELRLLGADPNPDGSPAWMIQDPVSNRFYRIGWVDFEILARWQRGSAESIARAICEETTLHVDASDVESLAMFLQRHDLVQAAGASEVDAMRQRAAAQTRSVAEWLLHHYLFFRIPLVRPQDRLARVLARAGWLFSPLMLVGVCLATMLGLVMVAHQWDTFAGSFVDHLTWQGAVGFAVAVAFAKTLHELGHALTATRYSVRVAHMGIALVVMFPMLYTDTSESWKLSNPRQRLAIASAGILTELALAGIATLLWSLSPDGTFRTAMFFLATTSWVLTLVVNASPFMRFDGYFIACDLLNFPNLHERAGNLARTWLRRSLLGLSQPWPEIFPDAKRRGLIAFALVTWVYRLVVFLGIAALVYLFFFKLLGIVLMVIEIAWFIGRPVASELREWWKQRGEVRPGRKLLICVFTLLLMLVLVVPWRSGVHAVGVIRAERQHLIFAPGAGVITSLPRRTDVEPGELLFGVAAPELRGAASRAQSLADARAREMVGLSGLKDGEERRAALDAERQRYLAEVGVFTGEQTRMQLAAPFAGRLVDVDPHLREGVWVQPRHPLAMLVDPSQWLAEMYVAEEDVGRIQLGDDAKVYSGLHAVSGKVVQVDTARIASLPYPMLDAATGGPIVTLPRADGRGDNAVRDGLFRVRIALDESPARQQMMLGTAVISGERRSLVHGLADHVLSVVIRESGF